MQAAIAADDHAGARTLLGIVCARKGQRSAAAIHLRRAIAIDPDNYEARVSLSTVLFAQGEAEEAIMHGERAIALQPAQPESYHHLARDLIAHGKTDSAIPYLRRALDLAPNQPNFLQDLAMALTETGQLREALALWERLTRVNPRSLTAWIKLGGMHLAARNFPEAAKCGRQAAALQPHSADGQVLAGLALLAAGDVSLAETHLHKALELSPNDMVAHSAYGLALHEAGLFEEARPHFERALEIRPAHGQSYYSLIRSRKTTEEGRPLIDKLLAHLDDPDATALDRSYMRYALGKANEDLGNYEAAMRHYDEATRYAKEAWPSHGRADRERYSEVVQATIETFCPSFMRLPDRQILQSETPLLVVGMIRSGTTLVEQILSSHPRIAGAGELTYWHDRAGQAFDVAARRVDEASLRGLAEKYLHLLNQLGGGCDRVIDKLPHNYAMVGFVLAAIPNARVIYVRRHAIDNCLSIYTTAYQHPPAFTLDRSDIVFSYREHERIMGHWKSVLTGSQLFEVSYEELVADQAAVTRRMVEFAGLEWDDACLHHERNARTVNTPSVWQVRQPVYKTSVERWRRFEPWLREFEALRD